MNMNQHKTERGIYLHKKRTDIVHIVTLINLAFQAGGSIHQHLFQIFIISLIQEKSFIKLLFVCLLMGISVVLNKENSYMREMVNYLSINNNFVLPNIKRQYKLHN